MSAEENSVAASSGFCGRARVPAERPGLKSDLDLPKIFRLQHQRNRDSVTVANVPGSVDL